MRTAAAMAVGFWAIDPVTRHRFGNYGWAHNTRHDRRVRPRVGRTGRAGDLYNLPGEFIFDVQSHHVDPAVVAGHQPRLPCRLRRALAAGVPSSATRRASGPTDVKGGGGGELDPIDNLSQFHYLKELFLDSATTMTVLSCVPTSPDVNNPLPLKRGGGDHQDGQRARQFAAGRDARVRDAKPGSGGTPPLR